MNELMEVVYLFLENQMLIIFLCNKIKKKTFSKEENSSFNPQKAEFPDFWLIFLYFTMKHQVSYLHFIHFRNMRVLLNDMKLNTIELN